MINSKKLLIIAGAVWAIAGINVLIVGARAFTQITGAWWVWLLLAIGAVAVFAVFHLRIFTPYAGKRTNRIASIEADKSPLWHFLDKKGYIIMAFMIALGASLRLSGLVPDWFIAFFYVGLGAALTACGINMVRGYRRIAA